MATNRSVTVLAPNGRRQIVKITPNTTILQVLEEVCKKHGYSPLRWDIKHFNQVLDANSIIRFTGLPNNAQLEMAPRETDRISSNVTIGLQLENGQRLMGDFNPTTTLTEIIINLCPAQESHDTVVIYMHQEIHGKDNLDKTTLQSLGLNNGRAMLRLLHRDLDKLKTQAHVSKELNPKSNKSNEKPDKNSRKSSAASITSQIKKTFDPIALLRSEKSAPQKKDSKASSSSKKNSSQGHVLGGRDHKALAEAAARSPKPAEDMDTGTPPPSSEKTEEQVDYLGERNALLFNQAGAKAIPREDLPDNFFDLTVDDAKALLRDAKRQREQLEELTTNAQRELDRNTSKLQKLHKYRKTIIRIQFPNQMVLQGIFGPLETVQMVKDFVREYLAHPEQEFVLYCTPPKKDLDPQRRLVDENLVPSAIIYYSGASEIRSSFKSKLVDPKVASAQAVKSRLTMTRANESIENSPDAEIPSHYDTEPSTRIEPSTSADIMTEASNRIKSYTPKWFKNAFK